MVTAAAVPLTLAAPFATGIGHATVAPSPTVVYVDDTNGDGFAGLVRATVAAPTSTTAVIPDDGNIDVVAAKLSPDGSRIAVMADLSASSVNDSGNLTLLTMNLDGTNRHSLVTEADTASSLAEFSGITWLGNSTIVYGWLSGTFASNNTQLRKVPASGGAVTVLPSTTGMGDPAGSPDAAQIAVTTFDGTNGQVKILNAADTTATPTTAATVAGAFVGQPAWSPDGSSIAYVKDDSDNPSNAGALSASEIDVITHTTSWSAPVVAVPVVKTASSAWIDELPYWADNSTVYFDRFDVSSSSSDTAGEDLWSATFDSGTSTWGAATDITNTPNSIEWNVTVSPADITAPSNVTVLPFGLGGTSITVRWSPNDADFSHVVLYRTDTTAATAEVPLGNKFGTGFVDTGLTVGHTYSYRFQTVDGAGNTTNDDVAHLVTATNLPKIVAVTPTALANTSLPFRVTWGVAEPAGTTYDVVYAVKGGASWALGTSYAFTSGTTTATNGVFTKGVPGQTYYFRATAHDTHGNMGSTPWAGVNVPLDQTAGSFSRGWVTAKSSHYWLGSTAATSTNGASYTVAATSKSVSIIGTKCAACGKFAVYVDGHYRGTVSAAATTTKLRQVLWTGVNAAIGRHVIKLVAVLAAHKTFQVDGVADPR
jgi:hypothetical protein